MIDRRKFSDPYITAKNEQRAVVSLTALRTLCNITCRNCYIESSRNDRLAYLDVVDIRPYLDEIDRDKLGTTETGFTGGEPFMNPAFIDLLQECLSRRFSVLVLTNAMAPMRRFHKSLVKLRDQPGDKLTIRVSLDHYTAERHDEERGAGGYWKTLEGLLWLTKKRLQACGRGRTVWEENETSLRAGYAELFAKYDIPLNADDPRELLLFPGNG